MSQYHPAARVTTRQFIIACVFFVVAFLFIVVVSSISQRDFTAKFIPGERVAATHVMAGAAYRNEKALVDNAFLADDGGRASAELEEQGKALMVYPGQVLEVIDSTKYLTQVHILDKIPRPVNAVWVDSAGLVTVDAAFDEKVTP